MTDQQWKRFFETCADVLGSGGHRNPALSTSWCAWTLFDRLSSGQPFLYSGLAHVVIPREYAWEAGDFQNDTHTHGTKTQDLDALSAALRSADIPHRLTELVLEIKLY